MKDKGEIMKTYEVRICRSREEHFYIEANSEEDAVKFAEENAEKLFDENEQNNSYAFLYAYFVNAR